MVYEGYENLTVEVADAVATVTLNRPERRNAIDLDMHGELERIWLDLAADKAVRAIILTGAGSAFSTGGDIAAMAARAGSPEGFAHSLKLPPMTRRLFSHMLDTPQPIIAAVNGHATGLAATLALFADIGVISQTAKFGDSHVNVGLVAGDGGAVIWPLLVGPNRAKEFLMRGKLLSGAEAQAMGLLNYAEPAEGVMGKALALAQELAALPPLAVQWTKLSVNRLLKDQMNTVLDASIAFEMMSMNTEDHGEAVRAFMEKRPPTYTGR